MLFDTISKAIGQAFRNSFNRFPISAAFITALSVFLVLNILIKDLLSDITIGTVSYYLSVGFLLSLTLRLWGEEQTNRRAVVATNIAAHLLLLIDAIYIYNTFDENGKNLELSISHSAAVLALFLTLFFLPFWREKDNVASWNFTMRTIFNLCVCGFIGLVMWGGVSLIVASFQMLFDIDLNDRWYAVSGVLMTILLPSLLFLGRIPQGADKFDRTPFSSAFLSGVMRFLFLPLVGLYILILYVYAIQILIKWELPDGWVSLLVTASVIGCIVIEFGLYPTRKLNAHRIDNAIARFLPLVILPLLMLMTVGIVRRLCDYGITVNRLYLITLNLWFYFVCIGLFATRARRINWVTISFALVFLATSAQPLNYIHITRSHIDRRVERLFAQGGVQKLPIDAKQYDKLMSTMPQEEAQPLNTSLDYLQDTYGYHHVKKYVCDSTYYISFYQYFPPAGTVAASSFYNNSWNNSVFDIPAGYAQMMIADGQATKGFDKNQAIVRLPVTDSEDQAIDTLLIDINQLKKHDDVMENPIPARCASGSSTFLITEFYLDTGNDDDGLNYLSVSGVLYKK